MSAMPAEKLSYYHREIQEQNRLETLIETVSVYRELVAEYPNIMVYRALLEEAEKNLKETEKRCLAG